ncbi:triple tyrosine motif-containing protein, partial [Clostridium sp. LP20]|uniref:triple tyrosine motif-containing protein n=1 Tax=Clostridium sp. LP20 TaxID=3418665 RepID=UPI003EE6A69E
SSILYKFLVKDSTGWKTVKDYSTSNSFTWNPTTTGNYVISVYSKDVNSKNDVDSFKTMDYSIVNNNPVVVNSITANRPSPAAPGSSITFTANATGGSSILYKFLVKDSTGWKTVKDYSTSNSFTWNPTTTGNYVISVYTKDVNSKNEVDSFKTMD